MSTAKVETRTVLFPSPRFSVVSSETFPAPTGSLRAPFPSADGDMAILPLPKTNKVFCFGGSLVDASPTDIKNGLARARASVRGDDASTAWIGSFSHPTTTDQTKKLTEWTRLVPTTTNAPPIPRRSPILIDFSTSTLLRVIVVGGYASIDNPSHGIKEGEYLTDAHIAVINNNSVDWSPLSSPPNAVDGSFSGFKLFPPPDLLNGDIIIARSSFISKQGNRYYFELRNKRRMLFVEFVERLNTAKVISQPSPTFIEPTFALIDLSSSSNIFPDDTLRMTIVPAAPSTLIGFYSPSPSPSGIGVPKPSEVNDLMNFWILNLNIPGSDKNSTIWDLTTNSESIRVRDETTGKYSTKLFDSKNPKILTLNWERYSMETGFSNVRTSDAVSYLISKPPILPPLFHTPSIYSSGMRFDLSSESGFIVFWGGTPWDERLISDPETPLAPEDILTTTGPTYLKLRDTISTRLYYATYYVSPLSEFKIIWRGELRLPNGVSFPSTNFSSKLTIFDDPYFLAEVPSYPSSSSSSVQSGDEMTETITLFAVGGNETCLHISLVGATKAIEAAVETCLLTSGCNVKTDASGTQIFSPPIPPPPPPPSSTSTGGGGNTPPSTSAALLLGKSKDDTKMTDSTRKTIIAGSVAAAVIGLLGICVVGVGMFIAFKGRGGRGKGKSRVKAFDVPGAPRIHYTH